MDHVEWRATKSHRLFLSVQGNELDHIFVYIGNDVKVDTVKHKLVADVANHQSDSECVKSNRAHHRQGRLYPQPILGFDDVGENQQYLL